MAETKLLVALIALAAASPLSATIQADPTIGAPPGTPATVYCLRVEPTTGTRIGGIECLTREQWADGDVDVDEVWARDGVRVIA
jgi:hypothetical protein